MTQLEDDEAGAESLGTRIRQIRFAQNLTIRQLAKDIGCSPSHISQIERNLSEPSISMLTAIASRLGKSVDSILSNQHEATDPPLNGKTMTSPNLAIVQKASHRQEIHIKGGVTSQLLLPLVEQNADFCEYIYEPAQVEAQRGELLRHPGREYGVVLAGRLHMTLKFNDYELEAGDSIAFDSSIPHAFWNPGSVPARVIWFSSPLL